MPCWTILASWGFPDSLAGKESTCNAGNPGPISGLGRSAGEAIGYPLQYSWASLVTQLVKNLPAMWETWVQCLDWGDLLEKRKATHSSILAWRIPRTEQSWGHKESYMTECLSLSLSSWPVKTKQPETKWAEDFTSLFCSPGSQETGQRQGAHFLLQPAVKVAC